MSNYSFAVVFSIPGIPQNFQKPAASVLGFSDVDQDPGCTNVDLGHQLDLVCLLCFAFLIDTDCVNPDESAL